MLWRRSDAREVITERNTEMEEILFVKAMGQKTSKWYEGLLTRLNQDVCWIKDKSNVEWICDPSTICSPTGLFDKNKKKIWQHDICIVRNGTFDEEDGYFTVKWDQDGARFILDGDCVIDFDNNCYGYECEVIGTIFDNPELTIGGLIKKGEYHE